MTRDDCRKGAPVVWASRDAEGYRLDVPCIIHKVTAARVTVTDEAGSLHTVRFDRIHPPAAMVTRGGRVCAKCTLRIGRYDKWEFGTDGRPIHKSCDNPTLETKSNDQLFT